jgi:hypothetical protein
MTSSISMSDQSPISATSTQSSSSSNQLSFTTSSSAISYFGPLHQKVLATSSKPTLTEVKDILQVNSYFKPKSFVGTMHIPSSTPIISRYENIEEWQHFDFYMSQIPDRQGRSIFLPDCAAVR